MKIIKKKEFAIFMLIAVVLAVVFLFTDLTISQKIVDQKSGFALSFDVVGEFPSGLCFVIGSGIIFASNKGRKKIQSVFMFIIGFFGWFMIGAMSLRYFTSPSLEGVTRQMLLIVGVVSLLLNIITFVIFSRSYYKHLLKYRRWAVVIMVAVLFSMVGVNVIKIFWGRLRFRDMTDPAAQFTRWIFPQGNTGNKSFPSGHSANSALILAFLPFARRIKEKSLSVLAQVLLWAWPITVGFSRVVAAAHFASDTLFGILITVTIFYILSAIFLETESRRSIVKR